MRLLKGKNDSTSIKRSPAEQLHVFAFPSATFSKGIVKYRSFHAKDRSYEADRNILIGTESGISACIYSRYCKKINKRGELDRRKKRKKKKMKKKQDKKRRIRGERDEKHEGPRIYGRVR
ncbi:PREDICTED: uncharacterized protein LOC105152940 isoform X2 [Acromyrmex echinatior]|uniref:uncharacterized protein LOC105152940 isoform X2 n=1 Tax=Acromyrmex echinatior TaxID=103372 RepID=UPI000580FCD1|nr:PREDICTED: uncharacterized protein LOC105152940 isoform X2 [Acromyrmex echinatior]